MKTQNPWMGRARGSAGNMTSSKVYDKNVMRAKAFEVNNPKTAAQTNERNFFADAQKVCQTVSEEQLRSLFGVKPKSKSRRNALLSQLLEAFSINNNVKEFDFSKLKAIGNGEKIEVEILHSSSQDTDLIWNFNSNNQGLIDMPVGANYIVVIFNNTTQQIIIQNTGMYKDDGDQVFDFSGEQPNEDIYIYPTYATSGEDVYDQSFGSFIIKTRAEKKTTSQPSN